ncbi:hypothetical protein NSMS1_47630 [Nostoc sp. MS1]|nr:hypothetical protein NSMS1_47630 [Nostoc sp. MS1]
MLQITDLEISTEKLAKISSDRLVRANEHFIRTVPPTTFPLVLTLFSHSRQKKNRIQGESGVEKLEM